MKGEGELDQGGSGAGFDNSEVGSGGLRWQLWLLTEYDTQCNNQRRRKLDGAEFGRGLIGFDKWWELDNSVDLDLMMLTTTLSTSDPNDENNLILGRGCCY